jgi:hypothetical protein
LVLRPLLFLIHVNDLPATIDSQSEPILYAGDTNIIIVYSKLAYLQNIMNDVSATKADLLKTAN